MPQHGREITPDGRQEKTIDITPTPGGFRQMGVMFQESLESYQQQLEQLETRKKNPQLKPATVAKIDAEIAIITESIANLQEGITELKRAGYIQEAQEGKGHADA